MRGRMKNKLWEVIRLAVAYLELVEGEFCTRPGSQQLPFIATYCYVQGV